MNSFIYLVCRRRLPRLANCFFHLSVFCLSFYSCAQDSPIDIQKPEKTKEEQTTDQSDNRPKEQLEDGNRPGEQPPGESDPKGSGATPESDSRPQTYTLQELEVMTYELEVIFHVLASSSSELNEKITSERMQDILNGVNDLYAGKSGGPDIRVRFVLAKNYPDGRRLEEAGIVRTSISQDHLAYTTVRLDSKDGEFHQQSWDIKQYINVYIFRFEESGIYGVSTYPDMPANHLLKGLQRYHPSNLDWHNPCVALNETAFGGWKKSSGKSPVNTRAAYVTAHELGHYLGLYHPFKYGTDLQDYCDDTKEYDRHQYENKRKSLLQQEITDIYEKHLPEEEVVKRRYMRTPLDGSSPFLSTNIMDYYDTYGNRFTDDQAKRMRECLYYSPILPGPKIKTGVSTRAIAPVQPYKTKCVVCGS